MSQDEAGQKRVAAPYIAYQTIKTFVAPLKEHVIPNRIDKSLLKNMSGAVQGQLMTALKFLSLIEEDGRPTDSLTKLVSAYGTDKWAAELQRVLANAYPELFKLPLDKVSPSQFNETFKGAYPCEGETLSKGVRFFLNAATEAGVKFSPFLMKNAKPRTGQAIRRRPRANARGGGNNREDSSGNANIKDLPDNPADKSTKPLEYQLIDLMTEADIEDEVKQSIWALVQYLAKRKTKAAAR
jgi:hypothetical protein